MIQAQGDGSTPQESAARRSLMGAQRRWCDVCLKAGDHYTQDHGRG